LIWRSFSSLFSLFCFFYCLGCLVCSGPGNDTGKFFAVRYNFTAMKIRSAKISDARTIYVLINYYAEREKMLFRSLADVYEKIQCFLVAELDNGRIAGCCALEVIWSDLVEIKSLAVEQNHTHCGLGKALVARAVEEAHRLGLPRIFALTLDPDFFSKLGFEVVEKNQLPMKVWKDCAACPKQQHCDEVAVIKHTGI